MLLRVFGRNSRLIFPPALLVSAVAYLCIYLLETVREKLIITPSFESAMEPERFIVPRFLYALARASI
jgi:hypothetical protein